MWVTVEGVMEVSEAPREVRMSAEPEAEVEALLPCLPVRGTLALCMGEREGGCTDSEATAGCEDGGGGGDVEGIVAIAAGADYVDLGCRLVACRDWSCAGLTH